MKFLISLVLIFSLTCNFIFSAEQSSQAADTFFVKDGFLKLYKLNPNINIIADKDYCNKFIESRVAEDYKKETKEFLDSLVFLSEDLLIALIKSYNAYLASTYQEKISDKKVQTEKHVLTQEWHAMEKLVKTFIDCLSQTNYIELCITSQEQLLIKNCQKKNFVSENYKKIDAELQNIKETIMKNQNKFIQNIEEFQELIKKMKQVLGINDSWKFSDYIPELPELPECPIQ